MFVCTTKLEPDEYVKGTSVVVVDASAVDHGQRIPEELRGDEEERVFSADTSCPRASTSLVRRPCVWWIVVPCLVVLQIQKAVPVD